MADNQKVPFRIALTADFYDDAGQLKFDDIGLKLFENDNRVAVSRVQEFQAEIGSDQVSECNGVIVLSPRVTADTLKQSEHLLAVGRFGVGYDSVNVDACTRNDVLAMITVGAPDRPVAEATIGWMLALTHHLRIKDQLVRTGNWDDRTKYMGCELRDRTLGVIGLGGIGRQLITLLKPFGMHQPIAFDPFISHDVLAKLGVRSITLDELLGCADFVSIHCPLNEQTRNLIGKRELELMKKDAYLLNTARGGIVNEDALYEVLKSGRIAGAALDCFEGEPFAEPHRFGDLQNVLLAPHSIAWTAELFRDIGRTACQSMLDLSRGRVPRGVLNQELFDRESFRQKWSRLTGIEISKLGRTV